MIIDVSGDDCIGAFPSLLTMLSLTLILKFVYLLNVLVM